MVERREVPIELAWWKDTVVEGASEEDGAVVRTVAVEAADPLPRRPVDRRWAASFAAVAAAHAIAVVAFRLSPEPPPPEPPEPPAPRWAQFDVGILRPAFHLREPLDGGASAMVDASPETGALGGVLSPAASLFVGRRVRINGVERAGNDHHSTFAADVDTAAYSILRRTLRSGGRPEPSLVRVEEIVNYFHYDYDPPEGPDDLFSIQVDGARSPVDPNAHFLRIGIQAKEVSDDERPPANLVFLVDSSCSMTSGDRLELAKRSIRIALDHLGSQDQVAVTTYAGGVETVLAPTRASERERIMRAVGRITAGGGTAMEDGMTVAYRQAQEMFDSRAINRVIVLSDGDANLGATSHEQILERIRSYVAQGITLTTVGFGDGNYRDEMMEQLANRGNGNYHYVDSERMASRLFGRDLTKMIHDVAKDVKIQVDFDPEVVSTYRLIGYENRDVADADFRSDDVDAGEVGAGHQVTALYEIQMNPEAGDLLATVRVRAKRPDRDDAKEAALRVPVAVVDRPFARAASDLRFAVAAAGAAEVFRGRPRAWTLERAMAVMKGAGLRDPDRRELAELIQIARARAEESSVRSRGARSRPVAD
jgi:Ca-activated chloride channel family protein